MPPFSPPSLSLSDEAKPNILQELSQIVSMLTTTIRPPPSVGDFLPLEEYESQTPETFFGGKPVLHHHLQGAKIWIPKSQSAALPVFTDASAAVSAPEGATLTGTTDDLTEQTIDLFVNSENFTIYSATATAGVSIPYPAISIHAVKQAGTLTDGTPLHAIWMQLELTDNADDEGSSVDLTIVPPVGSSVQQLYAAISACSDLHPDPVEEDDDEEEDRIVFEGEHEALEGFSGVLRGNANGGLPPPFPGSSGWITAENVNEYFDADGNWIGEGAEEGVSGELGEGAGRVRALDEVNGHEGGEEDSANKRPRVEEAPPS
ncbi:hypothetical protein BN1723_011702 [Verticillium longisporum]|uniref:Uncharacterized protein n=2 Tax=Verticillium longisporum TaxID=100787 RepID=A0A0G4MMC6_VERLO|nr:hypothetical protein BN1723_011702 [Verticillium longisporum]CRK35255.1 hypothetical protein BN1708_016432 [Verticillium longisporum]